MQPLKTFARRLLRSVLFRALVLLLGTALAYNINSFGLVDLIKANWLVIAGVVLVVAGITITVLVAGKLIRGYWRTVDQKRDETVAGVKAAIEGLLVEERRATGRRMLEFVEDLHGDVRRKWEGGSGSDQDAERAKEISVHLSSVIAHVSQQEDCEVCIKVIGLPNGASKDEASQYVFRRFAHSHDADSRSWQPIDDATPLKLLLGGRSHVVYSDLRPLLAQGFRFHVSGARSLAAVRVSVGPKPVNVGFIVVTSRSPGVFKEDFIIPLLELSAHYVGVLLASALNVPQTAVAERPGSSEAAGR